MDVTTHTPGSFCTAVLRTRDLDCAASFYSGLVGWTTETVAPGHRLVRSRGKTVASLHQSADGDDVWVPCVSVESVERITAEAVRLHAAVVDTADVPGVARLATLRDTEGAVFGLWEPAPHKGAELTEEAGSLWWIEVLSKQVSSARDFYGRLFGWVTVDTSFEPFGRYTVFKRGDAQEGGILPIVDEWEIPPRWNSIFAVDDCDKTLDRAIGLGGSTIFVHTVPKHGRIGGLCDPGGAVFVIRGPVPDRSRSVQTE